MAVDLTEASPESEIQGVRIDAQSRIQLNTTQTLIAEVERGWPDLISAHMNLFSFGTNQGTPSLDASSCAILSAAMTMSLGFDEVASAACLTKAISFSVKSPTLMVAKDDR